VLVTIGAMRASERSIRSAGPAALIAATGCPVWSRTAAPQQAAASLNSRRSLDQPRRCTSASSASSRSRLVKITTSDGVTGWGESFGPPRVVAAQLAELAGPLVGRPALLEFDRGYNPLREGVLATPLTFGGSAVDVPPGPGLGIEVDEDGVRGHELDGYHLDSAHSA